MLQIIFVNFVHCLRFLKRVKTQRVKVKLFNHFEWVLFLLSYIRKNNLKLLLLFHLFPLIFIIYLLVNIFLLNV